MVQKPKILRDKQQGDSEYLYVDFDPVDVGNSFEDSEDLEDTEDDEKTFEEEESE